MSRGEVALDHSFCNSFAIHSQFFPVRSEEKPRGSRGELKNRALGEERARTASHQDSSDLRNQQPRKQHPQGPGENRTGYSTSLTALSSPPDERLQVVDSRLVSPFRALFERRPSSVEIISDRFTALNTYTTPTTFPPLHTAMAMTSDWVFSEQELQSTPSQHDGMKYADELVLRRKACDFIEKMAKALDLPKLAQISADNYLHRFYMRQSLVRYDKYLVAAACVLLGSKAEESPKKIGYVAKEYIGVRKIVEKDQVFAIQKHDAQVIAGKIISMEGVVLHNLAYELTLSHPYKYINEKVDKVVRLQHLNEQEAKIQSSKIKQVAWSFLNDSAYTVACLRLESVDLAAGAVYLAGLYESYVPDHVVTANGQPWWDALVTPLHTLQDAARYLLNAYTAPYIRTNVLAAGLSKLVYTFHPPKPVESPAPCVELDIVEQEHSSPMVSSPMDSAACVTSPECGSSQGRSPYDHDFDHDVKSHVKDSEESPRETAQVPATPASLLDSFPIANDSSSADKLLGSTAAARAASNGRLSRKRGKDAENTFCSGKKFKYCL